jgi:hypothetical protein
MENKKNDWADEIPSSDSDEPEKKEDKSDDKAKPRTFKESSYQKDEPKGDYHSHEHSYNSYRGDSYRGDSNRGGFRGRRRRGGRGFRDRRSEFGPRLKLHPSYYLTTLLIAKPPFQLKIVVDKSITKGDVLKHFSIVNWLNRKKMPIIS